MKLIFVAGKGGVGKTTVATSLALQIAQTDRVTLISVDPAHAVRDVFAHEKPPSNLTVETIDTRALWSDFRERLESEIRKTLDALTPGGMTLAYDADAVESLIAIAPPGADELFAATRLADLLADESQKVVVVDTAPTGHFLRLLDLPRTAGEWVREFMRVLLRYRDVVPPGALAEELVAASKALTRLDEALRSEQVEVIVVTRPERIVVAETLRLLAELKERGIRVTDVVANALTPDTSCPCDQSMRSHESTALAALGRSYKAIERREAPVTRLADIRQMGSELRFSLSPPPVE